MQPIVAVAQTTGLSRDEVIARLTASPAVAGILLIGTTGTPAQTESSDHDLLLVLDDLPVPLRIVNTWIDHRLAEIYCTTTETIARIAASPIEITPASETEVIANWLRTGRMAFDRAGTLQRAQAAARSAAPSPATTARDRYASWRTIGYNVAQLKRYAAMDDPVSATAVDLRLLYSLAEVMTGYFTARNLPWRGEKAAVGHWSEHDPAFLDCVRACLAEPDRRRKVERYDELARLAMAPIGELWSAGTTTVDLGPAFGSDRPSPDGDVETTLAFWDSLISAN
jgi:hypothetical protein